VQGARPLDEAGNWPKHTAKLGHFYDAMIKDLRFKDSRPHPHKPARLLPLRIQKPYSPMPEFSSDFIA
jgi:hypothetical protein